MFPTLFSAFQVKGVTLRNRIVVGDASAARPTDKVILEAAVLARRL